MLSRLGKDVRVMESGMYRLTGELDFVAVTSDGICTVGDEIIAIEVKCPYFGTTGLSPESDSACRKSYVMQLHAQMAAIGAKREFFWFRGIHTRLNSVEGCG